MTFLSGESIKELFEKEKLILNKDSLESIFDNTMLDCNCCLLSVGAEASITKEVLSDNRLIQIDEKGEINIPSGQFAFILTEEYIKIPEKYMGFISIRSKIKFKGLINVSGFHVDPGYQGCLLFSLYNAGPNDIKLRRGDKTFQLWLATLDKDNSKEIYDKDPRKQISSEELNNLNGIVHSPQALSSRIADLKKSVFEKITEIDKSIHKFWWGILIGAISGIIIGLAIEFTSSFTHWYGVNREELKQELLNDVKQILKKNNP